MVKWCSATTRTLINKGIPPPKALAWEGNFYTMYLPYIRYLS